MSMNMYDVLKKSAEYHLDVSLSYKDFAVGGSSLSIFSPKFDGKYEAHIVIGLPEHHYDRLTFNNTAIRIAEKS